MIAPIEKHKLINFADYKFSGKRDFEVRAIPLLTRVLGRFLGAKVSYEPRPIESIQRLYGINIEENAARGVYIISESSVVLLGRVLDDKTVESAFALIVENAVLAGLNKLLNRLEKTISRTLTERIRSGRRYLIREHKFGNEFIEFTISQLFSVGRYHGASFWRLIDIFRTISNTQFEGNQFTTGLILTRSSFSFKGLGNSPRAGKLMPLSVVHDVTAASKIEKRFWFLVDGQTSFFICSRRLKIHSVFVPDKAREALESFVDDYSFSRTLKGGDALFRVTSRAEFSIIGPDLLEFVFKEGEWTVRNLRHILGLFKDYLSVDEPFAQSLLYFIIYMSRRRLSSIIWVPLDLTCVEDYTLSKNVLTRERFSILDERHRRILVRFLSSDGASIIATDGSLVSYGTIIDISKTTIKGVVGTGESVTKLLSANGLAVKISQDGAIKIFLGNRKNPIVI
ncbi:MAG: hypothetical protein JAZ12_02595 [Candidatus Thiodiazotropha taylori]|nr:hypothetical protein [Candidatus Thiodiazotropha taylori]